MEKYNLTLTAEELRALCYIVDKGWDCLIDGDFFYECEELKPVYEEACNKVFAAKKED